MFRKIAAALMLCAFTATAAQAAPRTYKIDPEHATIAFLVDHIGYAKVLGQFTETSGTFVFDEETRTLGDVSVTVEATKVFTNDDARDRHVTGSDFLDSGSNPQITFKANGGFVESDRTGKVIGDLTIRGVTVPIELDVTWNKSGKYPFGHGKHTIGVSARGSLLRSEYGMTYALGGIVGDKVELIIEVEAIAQD